MVVDGDGLWWLITHYQFQATCPEVKDIWSLGAPTHCQASLACTAVVTSVVCKSHLPGPTVAFGAQALGRIEGRSRDNTPGKHSRCQGPGYHPHPPFHHPSRPDHNSYPLSALACPRLNHRLTN